MPTWPATIQQSPDIEGYGEQPGFPVILAPVDGPPLSRRRYTAVVKRYTATFLLTGAELATFETFYTDEIEHGALAFDWRERGDDNNPVAQFRMVSEPSWSAVGGNYWRLQLELIRLPS